MASNTKNIGYSVLTYVYFLIGAETINVFILLGILNFQSEQHAELVSEMDNYHMKVDVYILRIRNDLYATYLWFSEQNNTIQRGSTGEIHSDIIVQQNNKVTSLIYDLDTQLDNIYRLDNIYQEDPYLKSQRRLKENQLQLKKAIAGLPSNTIIDHEIFSATLEPMSITLHQLQRLHENEYQELEVFAQKQQARNTRLVIAFVGAMLTFGFVIGAIIVRKISTIMAKQSRINQELKDSEERVNLLLNSTEEGIIGIDANGNCTFVNPSSLAILDYEDAGALLGNNIGRMIMGKHIGDRNCANCFEAHSSDGMFQRRDGSLIPVEYWSRAIVRDGVTIGKVISYLDISERKQREKDIKELNEQLEQRVESRTVELRKSNEKLVESLELLNKTRDQLVQSEKMAALGELVAGVAHEINTPLGIGVTAISHFKDNLDIYQQRYDSGQLTRMDFESMLKRSTESAGIILSNLLRAADLIRSFKKVAVDQTSEQQREFDLKQYIRDVLLSLQPKLKKTLITVDLIGSDGLMIDSYPGAISQVISNLVMNSLIHGFEEIAEGNITIELQEANGEVTLIYTDNGKGMTPIQVEKVFNPFFTSKRGRGGTGLGMHIVFNLVNQTLCGNIAAESTEGHGVQFTIRIPTRIVHFQKADNF